MLVLTRKKEESIVIGDGVTVTVLEVRGNRVRLGINAPQDTPVHRQEVLLTAKDLQRLAPQAEPSLPMPAPVAT